MSLSKLRKFVQETSGFDDKLPRIKKTPIVLSDSKASYLKSIATSDIEKNIVWWFKKGWNSESGLNFLRANIDEALSSYGEIHLYVWLGTCNLTVKSPGKGYITLNPNDGSAKLIHDLQQISRLADRKKFKVTFFEVPIFSIREWNRYRGHRDPDNFIESDKTLEVRIKVVNEHILRINESNGARSYALNVDLCRTRKNRGRKPKKIYYMGILKDGIHPENELSRCWLRKFTIRIKEDCY